MKLFLICLALINLISKVCCLDCDNVVSRQDIYKMSDEDRNRYFNAVKAINSGPKPTDWDKFAQKHVQYFQYIHGDPMFLAWHRKYLAELETMLKKKDPKVRIPVWDWTQYYNNRDNDPVWTWFGREGNRNNGNCVTTGQFSNFVVWYGSSMNEPGSNRCYTRSPYPGKTFGCAPADMNANVIDEPDIVTFWNYFEGTCHNSVHNAIGGDFSSHISTNDPLFFSHHAFVDMAWFLRQMRHPEWSKSYPAPLNTNIPYFNIPVSEVIDPTNLCYTYHEDNYSWLSRPSSKSLSISQSSIAPEPFRPLSMANTYGVQSTKLIDDHAREYVFRNISAPVNQDTHNLASNGNCSLTPLPDILSIEFIKRMHYNEVKIRELERKQALFVNNLNKKCFSS